jgi:glycosyltransferase involved in cell wall biosynthesis
MKGVCLFGGHHAGYPRSGVIVEGLRRLGVPLVACTASPRWKAPRRYARLLAGYARSAGGFDVVYVPEFRHKDVPLAWALSRVSGKACLFDPLVSRYDTRVHDRADTADLGPQAWHNRNIDRISMSLPDVLLADTHEHASYYARWAASPDTRIRVVAVGYDDRVFRPWAPPDADEGIRVLFYGSYLPLHGVDVIVEAAERLRGDARIHFDLVGGGQTFPLVEHLVRERRLARVRLLARVPAEQLPEHIARATICLGIFGRTDKARRVVPNKVYQCMGMERPVITGDTPAVREMFEDGAEVVLVRPGDGADLARAILALADDASRRARIAAVGLERVRREYSPVPIARRFLSCCEEAMDR